jgi:hypothetical protein
MARITSYPTVTPAAGDLVLLSDVSGTNNPTKTATASSLAALDPDNTLSEVLAAGNSATNNIALTGNFTGTGNITRTGNITLTGAQTISTTLGVTGTTTLGVVSLSSISGGWTNAGNTIADLGTVTTADINGGTWQGTIDGSWTAAGQTCADLGTVTTADINGGNIDGTIIGATTDAAGTFTNLVTSTMDGIVGSVTPQAGTFTTLVASGNLTVDTTTLAVNATTNNVGMGTASPNASALLDMTSTTQGFLPPVMTTTEKNAIGTPASGLMVFDRVLGKLCVYTGAAWETITSA